MVGITPFEVAAVISQLSFEAQAGLVILRYIEIKGSETVDELKRINDPAVAVILDQMRADGLLISTVGRESMVYRLSNTGLEKLNQYRPIAEALTVMWGTRKKGKKSNGIPKKHP